MEGFVAGQPVELMPGIRRILAPNAGLMTGPGTNTYLIGMRDVAVIDPGPRTESHIDAIVAGAAGKLRWVLVTHTHRDHSPAAARLAELTGAELLGMPAPEGPRQDRSFIPDRILHDGDRLDSDEFSLRALHTPGHASNHLCFLHARHRWLFTGDHIMNGSTVVIDPPDGCMTAYLASLQRLQAEPVVTIAPGHGAPIAEPRAEIDGLVAHRQRRESKVIDRLRRLRSATLSTLVAQVYDEIDARLHPLAERSLLAHLLKLRDDGRAVVGNETWRLSDD